MKQTFTKHHHQTAIKRMLQGAVIALILISIFLAGVKNPDPNWPKYWMLRPLIVVPIAGAMGGLFFFIMTHLYFHRTWQKVIFTVTGLLGFLVALWLGSVLGLNGTLWN